MKFIITGKIICDENVIDSEMAPNYKPFFKNPGFSPQTFTDKQVTDSVLPVLNH